MLAVDTAQKALAELRTHAGRNATAGTRNLHKGLGKFVSDARRDTGKFTTALKRDLEQARKAASPTKRSTRSGTAKRTTRRTTAKRSTTRKSS